MIDCYNCIHRGQSPGRADSCCNHPVAEKDLENPYANTLAILASENKVDPIIAFKSAELIQLEVTSEAFKQGRVNWPWVYNPLWIEKCSGFVAIKNPMIEHHKITEE